MAYFGSFPKINYFNSTTRNIILRAAIITDIFKKTDTFYTYIVKEGQRPDNVAAEVYEDPTKDWVVFFSNSVVDPYYDWPLSDNDLKKYLENKYSKTIYELQSQIEHYEYTGVGGESDLDIARKSWTLSTTTYNTLSPTDRSGWTPVYTYDYEVEQNDSKRVINLLSPIYLPQLTRELASIFNK